MAALESGALAPDFTLPAIDGKQVTLTELLKYGPVLLAFFKISCPVCQYAFPFFERVFQSNRAANVTILGVSQDRATSTKPFLEEFGVSFPVAIDEERNQYAVSRAYGLTNVPTAFLISPGGEVELSSVGWSKRDVENINQRLAEYRNATPSPLWKPNEEVRDFRAG